MEHAGDFFYELSERTHTRTDTSHNAHGHMHAHARTHTQYTIYSCPYTGSGTYTAVPVHVYDGFFKAVYIIANSSSTARNYWTILSGAESHGECATFGVCVEEFGAELLF